MMYIDIVFWSLTLLGVLWTSWVCGLASDINLEKFSVISVSSVLLFLSFFLLLLVFLLCICYIFYNCSIVLCYFLVCFLGEGCLFTFQFWRFFLTLSASSEVLFSAMSSLLMSSTKALFIFVIVFLISSISFCFFLRISVSLLMWYICSCVLFTLPIRAHSMLLRRVV